ncbi:MAG: META domain-containing protein [Bacteroidaceae bacterium]|nr:META domain-containing protein [Bacteroidaceae bacterium]
MRRTILMALVAGMALGSCTCGKTNSDNLETHIVNRWNILAANGQSTNEADMLPFIEFTDSGAVNGNASVNNFFGQYTLKGDSIFFDQMGATSMMGHSMDTEIAVLTALSNCATLELQDSTLYAKDMQGNIVLTMEKAQ